LGWGRSPGALSVSPLTLDLGLCSLPPFVQRARTKDGAPGISLTLESKTS
jgi:hypothetical protein